MKREILFRGMRMDGKGWVYGHYVIDPKGCHRIYWRPCEEATSNTYHLVKPETVGQFTGLYDKNGVKILEGDNVTINGKQYFIRFNAGCFVAESVTATHLSLLPWEFVGKSVTVTGNIHTP